MRQKPVTIEVKRAGPHWSVLAEEQVVALTVHEKSAHTLEAVLRGLLRYTSRKLFRLAVSEAMKGPKPAEPKAPAASKDKPAEAKPGAGKKPAVKKEKAAAGNPDASAPPPATDAPASQAQPPAQS